VPTVTLRAVVPFVTIAAGLAAWAVRTPAQPPEPIPAPKSAQSAGRIVGVGGCAAAACHNAPKSAGTAGTEYAVWVHDPHATAAGNRQGKGYRDVLARVEHLGYTEEASCLKCHATPTPDGAPLDRDVLGDGIGCEACHGPADKWRTEHYKDSWKSLDPKRKEAEYGFFPTKDLGRRIEKCAECHVGSPDKDVNHDLIAAGHPRLTFEYSAYHELLPRHWRDKKSEAEGWEKADARRMDSKFGPDFEAKAWLLGQAVTAQAAVKLTEARMQSAGRPSHPWPEFTEVGCFACHHDLKPKQADDPGSTWRQTSRYDGLKPGALPWGTWARPMPETLSRVATDLGPGDNPFADVATMTKPDAGQAAAALGKLAGWRGRCAEASFSEAGVRKLLAALAADGARHPPRDWDDAAQQYLALAALYQSLTDFAPGEATPVRRQLFDGLRRVVAFTADDQRRYDSPTGFTPEAFRKALVPFAAEFRTPEAP
jgi:Cytochrome c554 and c-prime